MNSNPELCKSKQVLAVANFLKVLFSGFTKKEFSDIYLKSKEISLSDFIYVLG